MLTGLTSDFANEHPDSEVIGTYLGRQAREPQRAIWTDPLSGTDLSPIQPAWTPPNCKFELDDASLDWTFADNTFDYIHIRCLIGSIEDWVRLYRECFRCLKPGGWLEHTDFSVLTGCDDGSLPPDAVWYEWTNLFLEAGRKMGRTFEVVDNDNFVGWLKEAGFSGPIRLNKTKLPTGGWPADPKWKEVGVYNRVTTEQGLEGYALYICTNILGWKYEDVQALLHRVRQAMKNKSYHSYYRW